jgi:hypothetical protein
MEESQPVVLLLMKDALHRPHCILEINHAIVKKIPTMAVLIDGERYNNNEDANEYLAHLGTELDQKALRSV